MLAGYVERFGQLLGMFAAGLGHVRPTAAAPPDRVIGLSELDATTDALRDASLFAIRNRAAGWSTGLSILTCMANVLPGLDRDDQPRAIYHGLVHAARSTANQPVSSLARARLFHYLSL